MFVDPHQILVKEVLFYRRGNGGLGGLNQGDTIRKEEPRSMFVYSFVQLLSIAAFYLTSF